MGNKSNGPRRGSRKTLTKRTRRKGLPALGRFLMEFKKGEKVVIDFEPSIQKGMSSLRMDGKTGTILEKRGRAYLVSVPEGNSTKQAVVRPIHLKKIGG